MRKSERKEERTKIRFSEDLCNLVYDGEKSSSLEMRASDIEKHVRSNLTCPWSVRAQNITATIVFVFETVNNETYIL